MQIQERGVESIFIEIEGIPAKDHLTSQAFLWGT
jgi:hypothetical protein